jgi:hypothetical protein
MDAQAPWMLRPLGCSGHACPSGRRVRLTGRPHINRARGLAASAGRGLAPLRFSAAVRDERSSPPRGEGAPGACPANGEHGRTARRRTIKPGPVSTARDGPEGTRSAAQPALQPCRMVRVSYRMYAAVADCMVPGPQSRRFLKPSCCVRRAHGREQGQTRSRSPHVSRQGPAPRRKTVILCGRPDRHRVAHLQPHSSLCRSARR